MSESSIIFISLIIIVVILLVIIVLVVFFGIYFFKKNKNNKTITKEDTETVKLKEKLSDQLIENNRLRDEYYTLINEYKEKIKSLSNIDEKEIINEYKQSIYEDVSPSLNREIKDYIDDTWTEANEKAAKILVDVMERISKPLSQEKTTTSIKIPNETLKAKIIGKEGRNKKTIENLTGTDLIIEKDSNYIVISSPNPIRRELALRTLKRIFDIKSIEASKIESIYHDETNKFNEESYKYAKDIIFEQLNIVFDNPEIYKYLARLRYRSSYGQNTLSHVIECAKIAAAIADELKLNNQMAAKAALLHDIGKSMDYELDKNHVDLGVEIATNLGLEDYIINAIYSHHDEVVCNNIYSQITKIADTISAARPGARMNSYNEYFERIQELEKIVNEFDEVNSSYAIRSGRFLRIIANPTKLRTNEELEILGYKIKQRLENNPITRKYKIKVSIIKENKYEFETSSKNEDVIINETKIM